MKSSVLSYAIIAVGVVIAAEYVARDRQVAELRREIAAVRERPIDVRPPRSSPAVMPYAARPAALPPQPAPEAPAAPRPREDGAEESAAAKHAKWEETVRANQAAVEAGFAAETVDRTWGPETRQDLSRHIAAMLPPSSSLREVDCRSSMCRVEMVVSDAAASQRFMESAFLAPEGRVWSGPGLTLPAQANPDGSLGVVMYLGREGTSLVRSD